MTLPYRAYSIRKINDNLHILGGRKTAPEKGAVLS